MYGKRTKKFVSLLTANIYLVAVFQHVFAICYREEKRSLKFIKEILEPFRVATRTLEGDTATAGHVIPVVRLHKRMWELKRTHTNNQFIEALQKLDRKLSRVDGAADIPI